MRLLERNNITIESKQEIPEKYREQVLQNITEELPEIGEERIVPGELGDSFDSRVELIDVFSDTENFYFCHGTTGNEEVIDSIMKIGLNVKNPSDISGYDSHLRGLTSTTKVYGEGNSELFLEQEEELNNWPHKEAKTIVIVSLPKKYCFSNGEVYFQHDNYEQFYVGSAHEGFYLRPEFIRGIYDASTHSFKPNRNFYKNLSVEDQAKLFAEIDERYIRAYVKNALVNPETKELPIDESKRDILIVEWYKEQVKKLRENEFSQDEQLTEMFEENNQSSTPSLDIEWTDDWDDDWEDTSSTSNRK